MPIPHCRERPENWGNPQGYLCVGATIRGRRQWPLSASALARPCQDRRRIVTPRIYCLPLGAFAVGTGNFVFVGVLDALAADLGVSVSAAGQLTTVFAVAYALSAPLLVAVTARVPRRVVLLGALGLFTAANATMTAATVFPLLLVMRVVAAAGAALYMPVAMGVAVELVQPAERGRAMSVVLLGLTFAFLLGIPAGTWIGSALGWQATFGFAAIAGAVTVLLLSIAIPALPGTTSRGLRGLGVALHGPIVGLLGVTTLAFVAVFCVNAYVGPILARTTGLGGTGIGLLQMALGVGGVIGVPIGGWLADRRTGTPIALGILVTIAVMQSVFSLLLWVPGWAATPGSIVTTATALTLVSGALFALGPVQQNRLIAAAPEERDIVLSLNASALFLGQGLGAAAGGLAIAATGLAGNGLLGSAIALAGIGLLCTVSHQGR